MPVKGKFRGKFAKKPLIERGAFTLKGDNLLIFNKINKDVLPQSNFTVEAVASIKNSAKYGSIISYMQDNGSYEKGWLLGYNEEKFYFGLATGKSIEYVYSKPYKIKKVYHIAATYNGSVATLYVNGDISGTKKISGNIQYPDKAFFCIGAYKDKDEDVRKKGSIYTANFYSTVLSSKAIKKNSQGIDNLVPLEISFRRVPVIRFLDPTSAQLTFQTSKELNCKVELKGAGHSGTLIRSSGKAHSFILNQLQLNRHYTISISAQANGKSYQGRSIELDTAVNYAPLQVDSKNSSAVTDGILKQSGIINGSCVLIGPDSQRIAVRLAAKSNLSVAIFCKKLQEVTKLRQSLYKQGIYGARINVYHCPRGQQMPFSKNLFNLIYVGQSVSTKEYQELVGLTKPGGMLIVKGKKQLIKKALKGQASWSAQYGNGGNTAYAGEELNNMERTGDLKLQWIGRPGADFGIDRNPRMPAPLAANGRLFHQGMNRMIAMDAHNGSILWNLEIPDMRRVNIPRDASNWSTDGDTVFTAVLDQLLCIDAATGKIKKTLYLPSSSRKKKGEWAYIGSEKDRIYGSSVRKDTLYKDFWSKSKWYDSVKAENTAKVCSDSFFCYSKAGKGLWKYQKGLIINTTISFNKGKVYFIETRSKDLLAKSDSRISEKSLWDNQFLVCLNGRTGKVIWQKSLDVVDGDVVFYMQVHDAGILITSSNSTTKKYHLQSYSLKGSKKWKAQHNWASNNHAGHMQHPVIIDDKIFLEPYGYNLKDGKELYKGIGRREGCHIYVGIKQGLLFRGTSRQISIWSMNSKKTTTWNRLRPSCWLSMIPAAGMLLVPEGGGGCSCGGWMETSLGFSPWETK
ncbi:MAG: hypothetical protein HRT88_03580 [Lentisphaeraceae bacterium]|nr:hypothetical protein [Lentisphaeraceae bacterium]